MRNSLYIGYSNKNNFQVSNSIYIFFSKSHDSSQKWANMFNREREDKNLFIKILTFIKRQIDC